MTSDVLTLPWMLARTVAARGPCEAFVAPGERLDWNALAQGADRIARGLHAAGVRHGDHVGVMLGNGGLWLQCFFACARLGAVTVPINTRFKTEELNFCLKQADVTCLIVADAFLGIDYIDLLTQVEPAIRTALPGEVLPLLTRVVVVGQNVPLAGMAFDTFLAQGDAALDLDAVHAQVRPDDVLLIQYTSGNDTIFLMLMGHPDFDRSTLHLRGGWAAAGPEVMQKIKDVMGVPAVCNAYGQSEASPNIVMSRYDDPFELRAHGWALPHPGMAVRIVEPGTTQEVPRGERGEIQARGWSVMKGYYKMPEATAGALAPDGWLSTGDLGEMDAEGRIRMVGRLKDMFRVGGENVAPAEVEEVLHGHDAVQLAQVIGVPDARLGEVGAAFVLLKAGRHATPEELTQWCKARCANFKVPRYLTIVDSFEHIGMTGSSKVQKNKLRMHAIEVFGLAQGAAV